MPRVDNPNAFANSLPGQLLRVKAITDDIKSASANAIFSLVVGMGGAIFNGAAQFLGGILGNLSVTGALAATGAVSGSAVSSASTVTATTDVNAGGNVSGTNIAASGQATSVSAFKSMGSYNYHVVTGYQAMWINNDGTIGVSASNRDSKKDLIPLTDVDPLLSLQPYLGRYIWDDETAPLKQFLIAEDVHAAGFGPDVAPLDETGAPLSINYSQLVPALIASVKALSARVYALEHPTA